MAPKASRIDDVKRPEKVTPSASGRPLLISNEPTVQTDPMMAPSGDDKKDDSFAMNHTGKAIKPLDAGLVNPDADTAADTDVALVSEPEEPTEPEKPEAVEPTEAAAPEAAPAEDEQKDEPAEPEKPAESKAGASTPIDSVLKSTDARDPDAAQTAEEVAKEEAKNKREQELEALVASGKYEVPIDAVQRKRSKKDTILLCVLAVVLAVVLVDVIADVGIIKVPASVPHTHFFSK